MTKENIQRLMTEIAPAKLMVVTKTRPVRDIRAVIEAGVKIIGENTLQEIQKKYNHQFFRELQQKGVELHYIGHLQTNKIRKIVRFCDAIHSIDTLEKAQKVNEVAADLKKVMPIFLELNLTGEEQKHGHILEDFRLQEIVNKIQALPNLHLLGFMCIGKQGDPEETRQVFRTCRDLANEFHLPEVSMGMSEDYQIALEEGSTMIRLGTVVFAEGEG